MTYHKPVLLSESVEALQLRDHGIYVDATLGGGGHTEAMLRMNSSIRVMAFDQDPEAIAYAGERLREFEGRVDYFQSNYSRIRTCLALAKIKRIDGVLFDLGVSSHQIDTPERGFSFQQLGDLDMRMDQSQGIAAAEVINTASYEELARIFRLYGEEPDAGKVARAILKAREKAPLTTTEELASLLDQAFPQNPKFMIKMKARIFQALRIHVNQELSHLETALKDCVDILKPGGRIAVITYHSLEDRLVKQYFREEEKSCVCPDQFLKCICGKKSRLMLLQRKPIVPGTQELLQNSRARSAKLRVAERKGERCN